MSLSSHDKKMAADIIDIANDEAYKDRSLSVSSMRNNIKRKLKLLFKQDGHPYDYAGVLAGILAAAIDYYEDEEDL